MLYLKIKREIMKKLVFAFLPLAVALAAIAVSCGKEKISPSTNTVYIDSIEVIPDQITLVVGDKGHLNTKIKPANTTNKKLNWESNNPSKVSVDNAGNITALEVGEAIITARSKQLEEVRGSCVVTVTETPIAVEGVSINPSGQQTLRVGGTLTLSAIFEPSNATNHRCSWSSDNASVATVSDGGKVTGKARGTANITVTTEDGGKKASVPVKVVEPFSSVKITSPTTSDSHYDSNKKMFVYMVGDTFQLEVQTVPTEAEDKVVFEASSNYFSLDEDGLVTCENPALSGSDVYARSEANVLIYDKIKVQVMPKPTGIALKVNEIPDADVVYKTRARDSWDIGVGATHKYKVVVEPSSALQEVKIKQSIPGNGSASFSLSGDILTVTVPASATPPAGPSAANKESKVILEAAGGYTQEFIFYTQKLDPYKAKEGDCLAVNHLDKAGLEDGGYRGNGRYDTKGVTVTTDFVIGSSADKYRNFLLMWVGNDHLTDDPLWKNYGPTQKVMAGSKELHGIAVPLKANKVFRSNFASGEIWQNDHTFIATNSDLPSWCSSNTALLENTSAKHSALFNTCAHVGANAGNGSSYEVRPAQFFVNDATKKPSTDKGINCGDDKYWSLSAFQNNLPTYTEGMGKYATPWLFPTLADMFCIFVGETVSSSLSSAQVAEVKYRIDLLKKRTGISDWNCTFWVSQEKDKDNVTRFQVRPDDVSKPVAYNHSGNSYPDGTKEAVALVYPIIYF